MSLDPIRDDITLIQGATYSDSYTLADADDVLVDLTGCSARMQIRAKPEAINPVLELSSTNGRLVLGGPLGTIRRNVSDEDTALLPVGTFYADLFLTYPDGHIDCLAVSTVTVQAANTRHA